MKTTECFAKPTITWMEHIGAGDCTDWIVHAAYRDQIAEFRSRSRSKAKAGAIEAVKAKVAALKAPKWIVKVHTQIYGPFDTQAHAETVRVWNTGGWGEVVKQYPCPKHPHVLRDHRDQVCYECEEEEIDATVMPAINDPITLVPVHTPENDIDFNEIE